MDLCMFILKCKYQITTWCNTNFINGYFNLSQFLTSYSRIQSTVINQQIYTYIYIYVSFVICDIIASYTYTLMQMYAHTNSAWCPCVSWCVCMCICIYVCICVCMYMRSFMCVHVRFFQ